MNAEAQGETEEYRVAFDFEIEFSNGGGLKGWDFRLDIDGAEVSDEALADYIVKDLRLLMVGSVRISNKSIFKERHKRGGNPRQEATSVAASIAARRVVDLSHPIRDGQVTYPGLPATSVTDHLSHAVSRGRYGEGVSFQIGRIAMTANSGTAIDAPYHRFAGVPDVSDLPLDGLVDLEAVVVRLSGMSSKAVTRQALLPAIEDVAGKAVLIETGWSVHWDTASYFDAHTYLTADAAQYLKDQRVALVGIDSPNIDDTSDASRPAHSILLAAGIPVVENLTNLEVLPIRGLHFSAAPLRVEGMGAFPVRAWVRLD